MRLGLSLALALACLLAPALLADRAAAEQSCASSIRCVVTLPRTELGMEDVWVDESRPDLNLNEGDGSGVLTVRAAPGADAWTLLRFNLSELPRNATILSAGISLVTVATPMPGRIVRVREVLAPWNEDAVTWNIARTLPLGLSSVNNHSTSEDGTSFGGGATFFLTYQNDCPSPNNCPEPPPDTGLTASLRQYYLGFAPYYGHVLRDEDEATGDVAWTQQYLSSSDANAASSTSSDGRPVLRITINPHMPEATRVLADDRESVNATSTRPVNLSLTILDRKGELGNAWINVTDATGREVLNRSVGPNRTAFFLDFFRYNLWTNESLNLTPGRYMINAWMLDNDGNLNHTDHRISPIFANLTIENDLPFVNASSVSATQLDEGQAFTAKANASDPGSGIAAVTLEVERAGEVLANLSLAARKVDANRSGDYELTTAAAWGGRLNLTIWVQDTAGNLNRSGVFPLRVRDVFPPVLEEARVVTPVRTPDGAVQEEGGAVAWTVLARDASPLEVTLELTPPGGGSETIPMPRVAGTLDQYRYERVFTQRGAYGARVTVRDPDGNTAFRDGLGFVITPPQPPAITELRPAPGGLGGAHPAVSALVSDPNIDPSSIVLDVRVVPDAFERADARVTTVTDTVRRVEFAQPPTFFHGEVVEVRVRARDFLGQQAETAWAFTVDGHTPLSFLTPEGDAVAGNATTILRGNTTLRLERSDEGAGVLATVVGVLNEDLRLAAENTTITGSAPVSLHLASSSAFRGTGNYSVFVSSVDHAGNVEPPVRHRYLVDDSPPVVEASFEPALVTARVREAGAGLRDVRVQYWLTPGGQQGSVFMSPSPDRATWKGQIPDGERGTRVLYAVTATDLLGNAGRAGSEGQPLSAIIQNHKPLVSLTPPNGSLVRGSVELEWAVTDRDDDAVRVAVRARPSTSDQALALAEDRGAQGSLRWDTRTVPDGVWVLALEAQDGFDTVVQEVQLDVANTPSKIAGVQVRDAEPGSPVRIEVTLYKTVDRAEAVLRLGAEEVARVPLADDGAPPDRRARDGVFTGSVSLARTGDYQVDLRVVFADGKLEDQRGAGVAKVQWGFPTALVREPLLLLLAVGVPAGLAGAWVYRRYGPIRGLARRK